MSSFIPRAGRRLIVVSACIAVLTTFTPAVSAGQAVMLDTAPTVTAVSPAAGSAAGGQLVTVTGTNLSHAWKVAFGNVSGTRITLVSDTRLTVRAPAHRAGAVAVRVTTAGGTSSLAGPVFTFAPVSALPTAPRRVHVTVGGGIPSDSATLTW